MEKLKIKLIIALVLLAVVIVFSLVYDHSVKNKSLVQPTNEQQERDFYINNCECLKHDIKACSFPGYEYRDGACRSGGNFTNPILKCSKYDCDGQIINVDAQFWEDNITS